MTPVDETVAAMVTRLDEDLVELWNERAAIRQHLGGLSRDLAEALALLDVFRMQPEKSLAALTRPTAT